MKLKGSAKASDLKEDLAVEPGGPRIMESGVDGVVGDH